MMLNRAHCQSVITVLFNVNACMKVIFSLHHNDTRSILHRYGARSYKSCSIFLGKQLHAPKSRSKI